MTQSPRSAVTGSVLAMSAAALLLAGCASPAAEPSAEPDTDTGSEVLAPEQTDITIGILPTPDYAPIQIAIDQGFFEEEGLTVTTEIINSATNIPSLINGQYVSTGVNWIQYGQVSSQGIELVPISGLTEGTPGYAEFLVRADSDIETIADLSGRTVAVVAFPGNCDQIQIAALTDEGVDTLPEYVNLPIPDMGAQIASGGVDAACVPEPALSGLMASGEFRSVSDLFTGQYEGFPVTGLSTTAEYAAENPGTVGAIQRALVKASEFIASTDDAIVEALPTYTSLTPEIAGSMVLPDYPADPIDLSGLSIVAQVLQATGLVAEPDFPQQAFGN